MSIFGDILTLVAGSWESKPVLPYVKTLEFSDTFETVQNGPSPDPIFLNADDPTDSLIAFRMVIHNDSDPVYEGDPINDTTISAGGSTNYVVVTVGSYNNETHSTFIHGTVYATFVPNS